MLLLGMKCIKKLRHEHTTQKQNSFLFGDDVKQQVTSTSFNFTTQYSNWLRQEPVECGLPAQIIFQSQEQH